MNRKNLLVIAMLAMAVALVGCDQEETDCATDADCAGYLCTIEPDATEGTCGATCTTAADCAPGFVCGGESETECVASSASCDELECNNYACDAAAAPNACYTDCTADNAETNCAHDICEVTDDVGACAAEADADPFLYVAVVSRSDDVEGANPGPDIDAISFSHGGTATVAQTVEASAVGFDDGDDDLTRDRPGAVLAKDVQEDDGSCNLDDWESAGDPDYFSLGGAGGYVVVSFGNGVEIVDGDTIEVIELDQSYCNNISVARDDAYDVYVGLGSLPAVTSGDDFAATGWCAIGAAGGNGGVFTELFGAAGCVTM